jgi:acyl-coenzyme A thioesterase PaaI-like protein
LWQAGAELNENQLRKRAAFALAVPLLEFLEISFSDERDPSSGLSLIPKGNALNALGAPHAGALSTVLELAAYMTLLPQLEDREEAVTHQFSASYLARADGDATLLAKGELLRRTRNLAFVSVNLRQEERLLATAAVTKSIFGT